MPTWAISAKGVNYLQKQLWQYWVHGCKLLLTSLVLYYIVITWKIVVGLNQKWYMKHSKKSYQVTCDSIINYLSLYSDLARFGTYCFPYIWHLFSRNIRESQCVGIVTIVIAILSITWHNICQLVTKSKHIQYQLIWYLGIIIISSSNHLGIIFKISCILDYWWWSKVEMLITYSALRTLSNSHSYSRK